MRDRLLALVITGLMLYGIVYFLISFKDKEITRLKTELTSTYEKLEEQEKKNAPKDVELRPEVTELDLLTEIRDLLKEKQND